MKHPEKANLHAERERERTDERLAGSGVNWEVIVVQPLSHI